jgi:glycosidase
MKYHWRSCVLSLALVLGGCAGPADDADSQRSCSFAVSFRPGMAPEIAKSARIDVPPAVRGDWDDWAMPAAPQNWSTEVASDGTVWKTFLGLLPAGAWSYLVDVGGVRVLDEVNPRTAFTSDPDVTSPSSDPFAVEVSEVALGDCTQPMLQVLETHGGTDGITVRARFVRGANGPALDDASLRAELWSASAQLSSPTVTREGAAGVRVQTSGLPPGKYTVRLFASDGAARAADPVSASAFVEAQPDRALADGLLYQIMIDRFRGPSGALAPPVTPGMRAGGTLDGVRAAVEDGYFDRLGVSTLWLSPVYRNPTGTFIGRDGHTYEAYHGYWPVDPRAVEERLGGEAALDALIASAHARGIRVIVDAVPNHVHEQHPYYQMHSLQAPSVAQAPDSRLVDWFNDQPGWCVCGVGDCAWGAHMETCWFDHYLPDVNWRQPDARQQASDDLAWWMTRFDLDGLRLDAVPMMPRAATRRIVEAVRASGFRSGLDRLMVGEIFTGPGEGGREAIREFLGEELDGLDSAFDFPLMWSLRAAAEGAGSFADVEAQLQQAGSDYAGSGATLARMLDNHDTTRFLSEAVDPGVGAVDPWANPPAQPSDETPYRRQRIALAYLLTAPGMPVIYYGDEVGLAGASDPDSRRVLPDVLAPSTLAAPQQALLGAVARLGRLRRCLPELRAQTPGSRVVAFADEQHLVAVQSRRAIVALSVDAQPASLSVTGADDGAYVDVLSGARVTVAGGAASIYLPPLSAAVWIPEASSCVE